MQHIELTKEVCILVIYKYCSGLPNSRNKLSPYYILSELLNPLNESKFWWTKDVFLYDILCPGLLNSRHICVWHILSRTTELNTWLCTTYIVQDYWTGQWTLDMYMYVRLDVEVANIDTFLTDRTWKTTGNARGLKPNFRHWTLP